MNIQEIDTRHGTANQPQFSNGNCLPYTGVPFGMNYFAPQTSDQRGSWWFHPEDRIFQGYRLTHQPSPWMGDFSHLLLTPVSGSFKAHTLSQIQSSYRPEESIFQPCQLSLTQLRYGIHSSLFPSMYGANLVIRYTQQENGLVLTLPGRYEIELIDPHTLQGKIINFSGCEDPNFSFYFSLHFEKAFYNDLKIYTGEDGFLTLNFGQERYQNIRLGTSFLSLEQAAYHLEQEKQFSADERLANTIQEWQTYFDKIQIEHHDLAQTKTFYHNLYRVFLFPQTFYEIDRNGKKYHYDTTSRSIQPGVLYTNNGFWDTYKTVYPFFSLFAQEKYEEILEGFLNSYHETGYLPKWLSPDERGMMPGTLIDAVIADAAVKGIRTDLMSEFLEAMIKGAEIPSEKENYGRQGTKDYLKHGYVPITHHESVNHTLDYAYSDFCISQVAEVLDAAFEKEKYRTRSLNYQKIFDNETGFMRGKDKQDQFRKEFDPIRWGTDYAEGSAWQSSFAVYHDFNGLIQLTSQEAFKKQLIKLCNQAPYFSVGGYGMEIHEMSEMAAVDFGQLAISNQPSFHFPYLFTYLDQPEMAQPLLKQLMTQAFDHSVSGYPGDEDNGSMAGWFLFNAMGFYPVTPGTGEYVIGLPLMDKMTLTFSNNKKLQITAAPNQPQQQFIHQIKRNDEIYRKLFFTHDDLLKGGSIHYHLGIVPNPEAFESKEKPYSVTKNLEK
ncbi:putative alpha-1,2-mannosidase [Enterococcus faecalis 13-SD-W-01]|nr:putative alpha-1,2-mannosidase [Enterococcus faecalis 13-SD-W-01]